MDLTQRGPISAALAGFAGEHGIRGRATKVSQARFGTTIPAKTWIRLQQLADTHRVPTRDLLAAALGALLHRVSGDEEIVLDVGDGRVNAARPTRLEFGDDPSLVEAARRIGTSRSASDAKGPSEAVLVLRDVGTPSPSPIHLPAAALGLDVERPASPRASAHAWWSHDSSLLSTAAARRLARAFLALLADAVSRPDRPCSALHLISVAERRRVVDAWNDTATEGPREATIHGLFEAQAAQAPTRPAVSWRDATIAYGELNARAERVAGTLRALGVGPGAFVGVCLRRGPRMVEALLGVLKAGAAYVPMDPAYPVERLAFMAEDAQLNVILTESGLAEGLRLGSARLVRLDQEEDVADAVRAKPPTTPVPPEAVAYLIYTSGSTGKPKGVLVEHRAVVNLLESMRGALAFGPSDVFLALTSLSFDIAGLEIYLPLVSGGRMRLAPEEAATDARALDALLDDVTIAQATPATWRMLLASGWSGDRRLRILCGGETMPPDLARQLLGRSHALWNVYGPTETTIWSTLEPLQRVEGPRVSIGRPIANTRAYVLDAQGEPVPPGVPGELFLGGAGVARGYHARPDLTRERFLDDPFHPGGRMYRTGDRARWTSSGRLDFLGRLDHQVKVRGFRIELGEIEARLREHASVGDAVVAAWDDGQGDARLAAYLTLREGAAQPSVEAWRAFLSQTLPPYMVPSVFVTLDALPLTPNGKIDRKALPEPVPERRGLASAFVAPRTPTEAALAAVFAEVLGAPEVGVDDDFFALGGYSLLATQALARVRERLGVEIPLAQAFETPTVAALARVVEARLAEGIVRARTHTPPRRAGEPIPVSFPQRVAYFMHELAPDAEAYHTNFLILLHGNLRHDVLEDALGEIVRRHEAFRTTFPKVDGEPVQVIHPSYRVVVPSTDLRSLREAERQSRLDALLREEMRRPFDLTRLPLARWTLFQVADDRHVLLHVEHHLLHDGWSFNNFYRELLTLYDAFARGEPSPLPELSWQFADFAAWQREWMESPEARAQLAYWVNHLRGSPPLLEIPADRPRPAAKTYRGTSLRVDVPPGLVARLREFGRQEGCTLFMTMLAGFSTLLHRYAGAADFTVGTSVANRRLRESEPLIGMIVNMLPLRIDASGSPTFRELLARVRRETIQAYANQDIPFERVVEELRPERSLSHTPLFQAAFNFHDAAVPEGKAADVTSSLVEVISNGSSKFDIVVIVVPRMGKSRRDGPEGLTVIWEYSTDIFDEPRMRGMVRHFFQVLDEATRRPDLRVTDLPLMGDAERAAVLALGEPPRPTYPRDSTVHAEFEAQAARAPERDAVVAAEGALTYGALNARANQLARHLRALGARPDEPVALCLDRGLDLVVGALAILKAGGAYVPLDPDHPPTRLALMVRDVGARLVLAHGRHVGSLPADDLHVLRLDDPDVRAALAALPADDLPPAARAESLAYVMYTSGSTGTPKGVAVPHRAIVRLAFDREYVPLDETDVVAQASNASFDASTFEIWSSLLAGARVVVVPKETLLSPGRLEDAIRAHGVTTMFLTTALFNQLARERPRLFAGLRHVLVGGDACDPAHVRAVLHQGRPRDRLVNAYGPTECTTFATWHRVEDVPEGATTIPIGRAIASTTLRVLDARMQPVPVGVPGELYIGGDALARGYWNQPELTKERFVPDPFSDEQDARLYRTGDLVRWREEGTLEFIGRTDAQVKIRGFRIEPREVETMLLACAGFGDVVVVPHQDKAGDKRLVAYVVLEEGAAQARVLQAARDELTRRLPEYMVPSAFVVLDALPLNANGKLDRAALPAPDPAWAAAATERVAPRDEVEESLSKLWADVLQVDEVGVHDDFFDLGGHSLLAMRVVARVRDVFGVDVSLTDVLSAPTIERFGRALRERMIREARSPDEEDSRVA